MRRAVLLLLLSTGMSAQVRPACAQDVLAAVRADRWAEADAAAAALPDPLARKLVLFFRLQAPGAARAGEAAAFLAENPAWPGGPTLARRLSEEARPQSDPARRPCRLGPQRGPGGGGGLPAPMGPGADGG